jgi:hypothetical protein
MLENTKIKKWYNAVKDQFKNSRVVGSVYLNMQTSANSIASSKSKTSNLKDNNLNKSKRFFQINFFDIKLLYLFNIYIYAKVLKKKIKNSNFF